jgi:hypothetical protein
MLVQISCLDAASKNEQHGAGAIGLRLILKVDFPRKSLNSYPANGELLYKRGTCKHEFLSKKYVGENH